MAQHMTSRTLLELGTAQVQYRMHCAAMQTGMSVLL